MGIFSATLAVLLILATPVRAAIPPVENLLPSDTLFLISVPDFSMLRAAGKQSPQWLFWNDPAMKPFHDKFMAKWNEQFVAPLEHDLGVKFSEFADLPQGQLTLAVTQNGWSGTGDPAPGVLFLLDAKGRSDLLKTNLAALRKKWADAGKPMHTETIRGISFSVVPLSSNDIPATLAGVFPRRQPVQELGKENKPSPPGQIVVGQFESLLIVGSSLKVVEPIATRLTGGALPPLADNALFAADRLAQFRDAPLYYGWFNAKTVFDVLVHIAPPEPNPEAPSPVPPTPWDKILAASGLTGLKSASFSYRESHDGSRLDFYVSVPEAQRQGVFKMIAAAPKDANPPAFVPADTVKFLRWRVDGQKSWATLENARGHFARLVRQPQFRNQHRQRDRPAKGPELRRPQKPHRQPGRRLDQLSKSAGGQNAGGPELRPFAFPVCRVESRPGGVGDQKRRRALGFTGKRAPTPAIFRSDHLHDCPAFAPLRATFALLRVQRRLYRPDDGRFDD